MHHLVTIAVSDHPLVTIYLTLYAKKCPMIVRANTPNTENKCPYND